MECMTNDSNKISNRCTNDDDTLFYLFLIPKYIYIYVYVYM